MLAPCPHPTKVKFKTKKRAKKCGHMLGKEHGKTYRQYHCECGFWHLASKGSTLPHTAAG